jgi:hypothetical protein
MNVDKLGTGYVVGARWRAGLTSGAAGLRYTSDIVTDHRLHGRTLSLRDPDVQYPVIRTTVPWIALRLRGDRGSLDLRAGTASRSDYVFLSPLGFEVPANTTSSHLGVAGHVALSPALRVAYGAQESVNDLDEWRNDLGLSLDLHTRSHGAGAAVEFERASATLSSGAALERRSHDSSLLPQSASVDTRRAWIGGAVTRGTVQLGAQAELRRVEGEPGRRWTFWGSRGFGDMGTLLWNVWQLRAPPSELHGIWGLQRLGYRLLERAHVEARIGPERMRKESGVLVDLQGVSLGPVVLSSFLRASRIEG